ncbi:HEAT repeat domain-containing protein [Methanofollis fontis]|uniref:HEAT repeat domain-containing protein n=1 Tax=Methanofollis fontis TaxID=2052832 RepID=A0A483CTN3_9EURY|nr:HEAT repeat domain-containing protein [Methanofollis fontis]TAJ44753.1 hypothetical protein CUJ86_05505 [Methanofollis fontis]
MPDRSVHDVTEDAPSDEALRLSESGDLDGLTALLFTGDTPKLRQDAALGIGMLAGEAAIAPFIDLFSHEDRDIRMAASWGLSAIGSLAAASLAIALDDDDRQVRLWAAYTLGFTGTWREEAALQKTCHDPDPDVRRWAAWALERIERMNRPCCSGC